MQPCSYVGVLGGVPQVTACWPSSWANFQATYHILSCRNSLQNWTLTWCHFQGQRVVWVLRLDSLLVVRGLNCFVAPDGCWCGGVKGGVLSDHIGREAAPVPAGKAGQPDPLVMTGGENSRQSGWKTTWSATWKIIGTDLVASKMFRITLFVRLEELGARGFPLVG